MTTYTDLEVAAIKAFTVAFNYDDPDDEISDNATAFSVGDIAQHTGMSLATAKGVIGSLTKKGLVTVWGDPDHPECGLHIREFGILEHYRLR